MLQRLWRVAAGMLAVAVVAGCVVTAAGAGRAAAPPRKLWYRLTLSVDERVEFKSANGANHWRDVSG